MIREFGHADRDLQVEPGSLAIFWLAQAGFVYKTPAGTGGLRRPLPERLRAPAAEDEMYGFKRIMPTPIEPEEVEADLVVCTHSHPDHFDSDAIPVMRAQPAHPLRRRARLPRGIREAGVPAERYTILPRRRDLTCGDVSLTAVFADHGELAPEALGVLCRSGDIRVWQVGDTAYRPDMWQDLFQLGIDVIIPPINGALRQPGRRAGGEAGRRCARQGGHPVPLLDVCRARRQPGPVPGCLQGSMRPA